MQEISEISLKKNIKAISLNPYKNERGELEKKIK